MSSVLKSCIAIVGLVAFAAYWDGITAFAKEQGWIEKTEQEEFQSFLVEVNRAQKYLSNIDRASEETSKGAAVVANVGTDAIRQTLIDPFSAKFKDVIVSYNPKRDEVHVCGLLNAKNGFGAYVGFEPFLVKIDLDEELEATRGVRPRLMSSMPGQYSDYLARLGGRPGQFFKKRCGLGFSLTLLRRTM